MTLPFGLEWSATAASAIAIVLRTTLLLVATLAASALLRRASAGTRHVLLASGLAGALVLVPAVALTEWRLEVLPSSFGAAQPAQIANARLVAEQDVARNPGAGESAPPAIARNESAAEAAGAPDPEMAGATAAEHIPASRILLALWLIPTLFLLTRLLHGALSVRRIVATAEPLQSSAWTTPLYEAADCLDLPDAPLLLRSDRVSMPFACGILRPTLVVPADADQWSAERRRSVLCHELAHVRRRDVLTHLLGRLMCAVHWFNPLVWYAARRLRAESERACDDIVLAAGARASDYADHLLQIVVRMRSAGVPAIALPLAVRREFEGRMLAILDTRTRRTAPGRRHAAALAGLVAVAALLVAAAAPMPAQGPLVASPAIVADDDVAQFDDDILQTEGDVAQSDDNVAQSEHAYLDRTGVAYTDPHQDEPPRTPQPANVTAPETRPLPDRPTVPGSRLTDAAREALISAARTASSSHVRHGAVWALGNGRGTDAASVEAMTAALAGDGDAGVREAAAWALGHMRVVHGEPALVRAAERDADASVRRTAEWALGHLRSPEAVKPALLALREPSSASTRMTAAWAIGSTSPAERTPQLAAHLGDPDATVRTAVAWALGTTRTTAAVAPLIAAFGAETDAGARNAMLWALHTMRTAVPESFFLGLLEHAEADIRARAPGLLTGSTVWPWPWPWPQPRPLIGN